MNSLNILFSRTNSRLRPRPKFVWQLIGDFARMYVSPAVFLSIYIRLDIRHVDISNNTYSFEQSNVHTFDAWHGKVGIY